MQKQNMIKLKKKNLGNYLIKPVILFLLMKLKKFDKTFIRKRQFMIF